MKNVKFKMPIDDLFQLPGIGILITGHVEDGTIKKNSTVSIIDDTGNMKLTCTVNGIISQSCIPELKLDYLESASAEQDDYWGIALIFDKEEVLSVANAGMLVVME